MEEFQIIIGDLRSVGLDIIESFQVIPNYLLSHCYASCELTAATTKMMNSRKGHKLASLMLDVLHYLRVFVFYKA